MSFRSTTTLLSRATRIKTKLQSSLSATVIELHGVLYQHADHISMKESSEQETHFNLKIVSEKFEGVSLVKRHCMAYEVLDDELKSGLHALSIVAKTPKEITPEVK